MKKNNMAALQYRVAQCLKRRPTVRVVTLIEPGNDFAALQFLANAVQEPIAVLTAMRQEDMVCA
jgi:hypothetical protein